MVDKICGNPPGQVLYGSNHLRPAQNSSLSETSRQNLAAITVRAAQKQLPSNSVASLNTSTRHQAPAAASGVASEGVKKFEASLVDALGALGLEYLDEEVKNENITASAVVLEDLEQAGSGKIQQLNPGQSTSIDQITLAHSGLSIGKVRDLLVD